MYKANRTKGRPHVVQPQNKFLTPASRMSPARGRGSSTMPHHTQAPATQHLLVVPHQGPEPPCSPGVLVPGPELRFGKAVTAVARGRRCQAARCSLWGQQAPRAQVLVRAHRQQFPRLRVPQHHHHRLRAEPTGAVCSLHSAETTRHTTGKTMSTKNKRSRSN